MCSMSSCSFLLADAAPEVVEKPGDNSLSRLKMLYTQAKELAESEVSFSAHLLEQLDGLMPPGPPGQQRTTRATTKEDSSWEVEGNEQKKKQMKADSDMTRVSPSMRHQEALANLKGEQGISQLSSDTLFAIVAARVTQENAEKDEWVIVKVIHFDRETKVIEVLDEEPGDDEERGGQSYVLEFDDDEEEDGSLPQRLVPFHRVVGLPEGHKQ
ncbi:hypothetical protein RHSIM_Rhsim10G0017400 [Rhododendron simsii]|uniref:SGF29 C-terminal domain-containing protein n=1 Tax=Rhododendron simsii TaxID=118357 RepID=A0A834GF13_RHOSS|nr:hypothetical protein RHSIM_Rhsim10G0017400 [Rhododendron simsii]